jgi:hypothetical protein
MTPDFETAAKIADAVMYEGYILYPYRASAMKNRFRWQFGVLGALDARSDARRRGHGTQRARA